MNPNILIIAEIRDGSITKPTRQALGLGLRLAAASGGSCDAALFGAGGGADVADAAGEAAKLGPARVIRATHPALAAYSADAWTRAAAAVVEAGQYGLMIAPASAWGRDLMPRVAARLGIAMISECTGIDWNGDAAVFHRSLYGGKLVATTRSQAGAAVATLRPNVAEPATETGRTAPIEDATIDPGEPRSTVEERVDTTGGQPQVTEASIIVSGGRGLQKPENFRLIVDLASALNAAVGASRAVVDAGWVDHSHQVGQTGATVAPALYIACGISGAIQHVAGMATARTIVAINRDAEAPIFKVADYGIVGDAAEVLPILTQKVKAFLA